MSQYSLEMRWRICEPKVHYSGDVGPKGGFECGFVLIFLCNADVFVSPSDVELREQLLAYEQLQDGADVHHCIIVPDSVFVDLSVVLRLTFSFRFS
jgi:hypothetical protein